MKTPIMSLLGLLLASVMTSHAYARVVTTDKCQHEKQTKRLAYWQNVADEKLFLEGAGNKILSVHDDEITYCDSEMIVPEKPVCFFTYIDPRGSVTSLTLNPQNISMYGVERMLFAETLGSHRISVNSSPHFADIEVSILDLLTNSVVSEIQGGGVSTYYSNKNPKPFKQFIKIKNEAYKIECKYIDVR